MSAKTYKVRVHYRLEMPVGHLRTKHIDMDIKAMNQFDARFMAMENVEIPNRLDRPIKTIWAEVIKPKKASNAK